MLGDISPYFFMDWSLLKHRSSSAFTLSIQLHSKCVLTVRQECKLSSALNTKPVSK
jgi:hypothetical protein